MSDHGRAGEVDRPPNDEATGCGTHRGAVLPGAGSRTPELSGHSAHNCPVLVTHGIKVIVEIQLDVCQIHGKEDDEAEKNRSQHIYSVNLLGIPLYSALQFLF